MSKNAISEVIAMAFEEGYRSPYEVKPAVVESLLRLYESKIAIKLESSSFQEMAGVIYGYIPQALKQILSHNGVWLCGGAVIRLLCDPENSSGSWRNSDYDLYCTLDVLKDVANTFGIHLAMDNKKYPAIAGDEQFKTYRAEHQDMSLNFIVSNTFTGPAECIKDFDLSVVRFAFSASPKPELFGTKDAYIDLCMGQVRLVNPYDKKAKVARIKKYVRRGFRDVTGIVEKGAVCSHVKNLASALHRG
jgi:hypothetical protein